MGQLIGATGEAEFWPRWLASRWVRDFERGRCSDEEFAAGIVIEWGLTATGAELLAAFESKRGAARPDIMITPGALSKRPMLAIAENALTVILDMTTTPTAVDESW